MARVARLTADLTANTSGFEAGMKRAQSTSSNFRKNVEKNNTGISRSFGQVSGSVNLLIRSAGGLAAVFAATKLVAIGDQMTSLTARIKNSTNSVEEFNQAFAGLSRISIQTGGDLSASVDVFQRLSFVRKEIGSTIGEMLTFTETVQKLGIVSGASTQALNAGLLQLGQGLSAGVLRAEEFNSITENIPLVAKSIAEEFGVSTGQLRQLVIEGKVLSQDVFTAILNQSVKANEQFEKMPLTVERANAQLRNQFNLLVQSATGLSGTNELLAEGLQNVSDIIGEINSRMGSVASTFDGVKIALKEINVLFLEGLVNIRAITSAPDAIKDSVFGTTSESVTKAQDAALKAVEARRELEAAIDRGANRDLSKPVTYEAEATEVRALSQDYAKLAENIAAKNSDPATKKSQQIFENLEKENQQLSIQIQRYGQSKSTIEAAQRQMQIMQDLKKNDIKLSEEQKKKLDEYLLSIENQASHLERLDEAQKRLQDQERARQQALANLATSFEGAFENAIVEGQKLSDVLKGLLKDILRLTVRQGIIAPLVNGIFGGMANQSFGSLFGGGADTITWDQPVGSFATGIDYVPRDMMAMVHKGEQIIPRQQVDAMNRANGGGETVQIVQNVTIGEGVSMQVRQEVSRMLPELKRSMVSAVEDARLRGVNV